MAQVFQPLDPTEQWFDTDQADTSQPTETRPVFQPAPIELPAQTSEGETHIELTRPGRAFKREPLPDNVMPAESDQLPVFQPGPGAETIAPRAFTRPVLAARQQAEQFGGDFAQRAPRAGAVGAAAQQALQFDPTSASAAAAAGIAQQNFVQEHSKAQVNSPASLYNYANDLYGKTIGNFESLINTVREGKDTDDLQINRAVDLMLPDGSPEDKAAFRQAFIAGTPDQRSQWMGALLPYVSGDTGLPVDTATLSDALDRKNDPAYQAAKAKSLKDAQDEANTLLEGDDRLKGTTAGNVISQIAALPAYAAAANPLIAPVGVPVIFNRIFTDTRQAMQQQHPDWNDQQLDQSAAETAIINTVGSEVGSRIIGAGLGPLLKNLRGGYLARAAVQVPATAAAQAGVGAATQAATNIAQGKPVGDSVLEATLGQGIVGGMAGAAHATVHPPLAPEVAPTTGPSGARVRGPTEATLEQGATEAAAPPEAQPVLPVQPTQPAPVEPVVAPEAQQTVPQVEQPPPAVVPEQPVAPTRQAVMQRAFEISQERARAGATGDPTSDWLQAQSELAAEQLPAEVAPSPPRAPEAKPVTAEEPWVSQIANRFTEQRVAAGEIGEIAPGQGYATRDLVDLGKTMRPEEVTQHMSDLMNNRGGDPIRQAAAIRYEEARLSERNQRLSRVAEANPGNALAQIDAENAFKDLIDFHNGPLARQKNVWHAQGMSMQGEIPVDLSTYNGLREQWLRDQNGKAPPPDAEPVIRRRAAQVRDATNAENAARKNATEIDRYPEKGLPSDEDLRRIVRETMGQIPCLPI